MLLIKKGRNDLIIPEEMNSASLLELQRFGKYTHKKKGSPENPISL